MIEDACPVANPIVVLREEFDDWAILFDPDTGITLGLNPTGVFIWKLLDGKHSSKDILRELERVSNNVPADAGEHIHEFIEELGNRGLVGQDTE